MKNLMNNLAKAHLLYFSFPMAKAMGKSIFLTNGKQFA